MSESDIPMVTLKNGASVPQPMVSVLLISLTDLAAKDPIALYELVMLCRDPNHQLFTGYHERLLTLALIEPTTEFGRYIVHDITRDVVLSMAVGDPIDMQFVNPLAT